MKTLKLFLIVSLLFVSGITKAQDVIVKKDNSTILSKITKIGETEIEYKKWSNLDGPTYVINVSDVLSLNFENGEVEKFDKITTDKPVRIETSADEVNTNNISENKPEQVTKPKIEVSQQIGYMERDGNGLTLDGRDLSDDEVLALVGKENYETYMSAKKQINVGRVFTPIFFASLGATIIIAATAGSTDDAELLSAAIATGVIADISLPIMCIMKGAGKGRMNWVADEYNRTNRGYSYSYSLSPSIMASKTPQLQNTYGLGLTLSFNF